MKFLNLLLSLVPCRTTRAVDSAWCDGFLAGTHSAGICRDSRGRWQSITNRPKRVKPRVKQPELFKRP